MTTAVARLAAQIGLVLALAMAALPAQAARRVALVIGIDAYQQIAPLQKAVGDARAVAAALKSDIAFDTVLIGENLTRSQMARKLAELDGAVQPGDTVLFFFSGHGVALSSQENVLLPADIAKPDIGQEGLVRDDGFPVDGIIRRIQQRGASVSLMILDACRDNPFEQLGVRSVGASRGLARIEAPLGVFVLYSAGLGQKALDRLPGNDPAPTSVFTRHLLPAMTTPGLSHVQIAKRVQQEVSAVAARVSHAQQPAYYDQIVGDVVLRAAVGTTAPLVVPTSPAEAAFNRIENSSIIADIEAWRKQFGSQNPYFDRLAANRIDALRAAEAEALTRQKPAAEAAQSPQEAKPLAAEKIKTSSLPADVPVTPAILQLIAEHPFFADSPPVRAGLYRTFLSSSFVVNGSPTRSTYDDTRTLRQLGHGVYAAESQSAGSTVHQSCPSGSCVTSSKGTYVLAGNGLIVLGYKSTFKSKIGNGNSASGTSTQRLTRLDNIQGALFPMAVGNRFAYRETHQTTDTSGKDQVEYDYRCAISKKFEASNFHTELTGSAFLKSCFVRTSHQKNADLNNTREEKELFFDALGVWIAVDSVNPREVIVQDDTPQAGFTNRSSFTTLKAIAMSP